MYILEKKKKKKGKELGSQGVEIQLSIWNPKPKTLNDRLIQSLV